MFSASRMMSFLILRNSLCWVETEKVLTEEISKAIIDAAHEFMETKN